MPRFLVRTNCEYTKVIDDAKDEDDAIAQANGSPMDEWDQTWSESEVDKEATEELNVLDKENKASAKRQW